MASKITPSDAIDADEFDQLIDTLNADQQQHAINMIHNGAKQVDPHGISGYKVVTVSAGGMESERVPSIISIEIFDRNEQRAICMNRASAKDLIRILLEFI